MFEKNRIMMMGLQMLTVIGKFPFTRANTEFKIEIIPTKIIDMVRHLNLTSLSLLHVYLKHL